MTERRDMKQDSYVTSASLLARVSDDTQSQGGAGWLLMKRGLYWRPNGQGYTGLKHEAGRYTEAEAQARTGHDRTETTAIHEDDAPSFAPGCSIDVKYDFLSRENRRLRRGLTSLIRKAECGEWTLPSSFANCARDLLQRSVSDGSPAGVKTGTGLIEDDSAVTAGQTPQPSPVDYTEVAKRLNWSSVAVGTDGQWVSIRRELRDQAAQVIEAQAAEIERLKEQLRPGSPTERAPTEWAYGAACRAIEKHRARADTAEARIAELEKERDRKDEQIDKLLQHCPDAECSTCSEIICPHGDDLHFHHDGCPSCYTEECRALSTGGDSQ